MTSTDGPDNAGKHSETHTTKRVAYEPALDLVKPLGHDPNMKRPISTVAGAMLVFLRVIAGVVWVASVVAERSSWDVEFADLIGTDQAAQDAITLLAVVFVVIGGLVLLVEALLGVFVLRGGNRARVIVMIFSTLAITGTFLGWWFDGETIALTGTLIGLAVDILILLALSSRKSAAYARRNEPSREDEFGVENEEEPDDKAARVR